MEQDCKGALLPPPSRFLYHPCRLQVQRDGVCKVVILYGNRVMIPADLDAAQMLDPKADTKVRTTHLVSTDLTFCSEEGIDHVISDVTVESTFDIPRTFRFLRFYRYGFAPCDTLKDPRRETRTTKEWGLSGVYTRPYFNLVCMGSGKHVLEFDGTEIGVHRLNSDNAICRFVADRYGLHLSKFAITFTGSVADCSHSLNHWRVKADGDGFVNVNRSTLTLLIYSQLATIYQASSHHQSPIST